MEETLENSLCCPLLPSPCSNCAFLSVPAAVGTQATGPFTKEPYSQDALHGRSAILRCEVKEPAGVEFEWLQNGLPIQDTEQRFKEGSNLQFAAVDRHRDAGSFQCVARNLLSGEESRSANASFNIKCECAERALRRRCPPWAGGGALGRGREAGGSFAGLPVMSAVGAGWYALCK